ncbi:MAG: flavodoxin-dependent (E)-4-hydroxy-3-methylbut-2-enyl-diphosphate synthase [bacterium]
MRKKTKTIKIGKIKVGGNNPVAVQSMCNTKTHNVPATVKQITELQKNGCEIIRVAVPDMRAAKELGNIKSKINIPLVADIHFDWKLAIEAANQGVDKIRINPGNIGSEDRVKEVVKICKKKNIPIRIGVNSGSLEKKLMDKYGGPTTKAMVESVINEIKLLEKLNFKNIVVSAKASTVPKMIEVYHKLSKQIDYPLHLGVTEAGTQWIGTIKSSIGIGSLLAQGIGDTFRVSLTADPVQEVKTAWEILKSLEIRNRGRTFISCPTCGRTQINLIKLATQIEKLTENIEKPIKIAVMGCVVNGPGEAREADIGIAGGKKQAVIFKKGKIICTVPESEIVGRFMEELGKIV